MPLLIRKIDKAKWLQNDIVGGAEVSADAITNCVKTTKNTLSTWRIDDEAQLNDAVLAIVSVHDHLDTIDIVCMNQQLLVDEGINFQDTLGKTLISDMANKHVDVVDLTYKSLGIVANCITKCFAENSVKRYTRSDLKKLFQDAIQSGRLSVEKIAPSIAEKL